MGRLQDPPTRRACRVGYRNTRIEGRYGCHARGDVAFLGGKRHLIHHRRVPGGCPSCASSFDVDPAHSLFAATSAGRNLITLFFTVNTSAHDFFPKPHAPTPLPVLTGAPKPPPRCPQH